ncbi:haloacid dehalogenase type II [Streptomyces sp. DSM 42041]|uniref:Haloacid dehalogenase type II n=1 Tax=Streptomyces hazeniae TaxID=3075538 RepID=A0ABU2P0C8_9ACTN|nr:haloacid dehalogenase type II [Streptomyces sp. DSM 42041]MDT0382707.1 haloacid dehalogenase type II [Streptomyces sp. DSM 42041]
MPTTPRVVIFDVNQTLSDMSPLRWRFEEVGVPGHLLATWFAGVLRDGIALAAAGAYADFRDVARAGLVTLFSEADAEDPGRSADHILDGFAALPVHPDVPDGVRALYGSGLRLATMTNGSARTTERLLGEAGLGRLFEAHLDVSGPGVWKPAPAAYRYAVERLGVDRAEAVLVAVHPWDVDGALRAGLSAVWLRRIPAPYPAIHSPPTHVVDDLRDLPAALGLGRGTT